MSKLELQIKGMQATLERYSQKIAKLEAERDALKADAERYQRVRRMASCGELPREWTEGYTERELDAAVDAAKGE